MCLLINTDTKAYQRKSARIWPRKKTDIAKTPIFCALITKPSPIVSHHMLQYGLARLIVNPSIIKFADFFSEEAGLRENLEISLSIVSPMQMSIPDPVKVSREISKGFLRNRISPNMIHVIIAISIRIWPKMISGPAFAPRFALSWITVVSRGPGASAPEKAIKKEIKNIET